MLGVVVADAAVEYVGGGVVLLILILFVVDDADVADAFDVAAALYVLYLRSK